MGNKQSSSSSKIPSFQYDNWHIIPSKKQYKYRYNYTNIYRNNLTN